MGGVCSLPCCVAGRLAWVAFCSVDSAGALGEALGKEAGADVGCSLDDAFCCATAVCGSCKHNDQSQFQTSLPACSVQDVQDTFSCAGYNV